MHSRRHVLSVYYGPVTGEKWRLVQRCTVLLFSKPIPHMRFHKGVAESMLLRTQKISRLNRPGNGRKFSADIREGWFNSWPTEVLIAAELISWSSVGIATPWTPLVSLYGHCIRRILYQEEEESAIAWPALHNPTVRASQRESGCSFPIQHWPWSVKAWSPLSKSWFFFFFLSPGFHHLWC